jgi:phosphoglycerate kinase
MYARTIPKVQDLELKNKRVFVRVDFNVPLKQKGDTWEVTDSSRIEGALQTIRHVSEVGGKVILASHLGRPKGKHEKKYSLEPVGARLSELLGKDVILTEDCIGDAPRGLSHQMKNGDVLLLENLRFHAGEEENSPDFVAKLMELCDVYVNDGFGTLHRAHASTYGIPKLMPLKAMGLLVQKELEYLEPLRENPTRPFALLMGGAKVSDKIGVLEQFLPKTDKVFIGGAMAYAFLSARGKKIGKSLCDHKQVQLASKIMRGAEVRGVKIFLPIDHVTSLAFDDTKNVQVTTGEDIPENRMGLDIGPKTVEHYRAQLEGIETLFWNGPMGVFEVPAFAQGTFGLAKAVAETRAKKLAGGGDVSAALAKAGVDSQFDFISTGGGATLEYLEGKELPGLKVLEVRATS